MLIICDEFYLKIIGKVAQTQVIWLYALITLPIRPLQESNQLELFFLYLIEGGPKFCSYIWLTYTLEEEKSATKYLPPLVDMLLLFSSCYYYYLQENKN